MFCRGEEDLKSIGDYSEKELVIDGIKTYVISPDHYEEFLKDDELLKSLDIRGVLYDVIPAMMENAKQIRDIKIGFAIALHNNRKSCRWEPVNVYEDVCHVFIRSSWMCRNCGHKHDGIIIMPMAEADAIFLERKELQNFEIPELFGKIKCDKCGKKLQNHLYVIREAITK